MDRSKFYTFGFILLFFLSSNVQAVEPCFDGYASKDNEIQFADCKEKAELDDPKAQLRMSSMYRDGATTKEEYKKAILWAEKAANQGYIEAYSRLGWLYAHSYLPDDEKAVKWYRKGAEAGDSHAQFILAEMYHKGGKGLSIDYQQAKQWYRKSAEQGNSHGQYGLGKMYYGTGTVPKKNKLAFNLFKKAAENRYPDATLELGIMYKEGHGVSQDYLKSYIYLQTALVLELYYYNDFGGPAREFYRHRDQVSKKLTLIQINKAKVDIYDSLRQEEALFAVDVGVFDTWLEANMRQEKEKGFRYSMGWYYSAMESGSQEAQRFLVKTYQFSSDYFTNDDQEIDFKDIKRYIEKGYDGSQIILAHMYFHGKEVAQDKVQALHWYKQAAKLKEDEEKKDFNTMAMHLVAWMYDTAQGIPQDYKQAFDWYQKAADLGYGDAQLRLAEMYQQGQGVEQSNQLAIQWYKTAAEQGYNKAQRVLADLYRDGILVEQDKKQAFEWYKKAAVLEELDAQYALAQMYAAGEGVAKSPAYAYLFSNYLAQQYSHIEAQQLSAELVKEMTDIDLALEKEWGEQWLHDAKYRTLGVAVEPPFEW